MNELIRSLVAETFGPDGPGVEAVTDANGGRGVFSDVVRVRLSWPSPAQSETAQPATVVIKAPAEGVNGAAAVESGACRREALAYRHVLSTSPIDWPTAHLVRTDGDAAWFVLEDLGALRAVDQLDGLAADDGLAVARALARFHQHWAGHDDLSRLDVRRSTPSVLSPDALAVGLATLDRSWAQAVDDRARAAFEGLLRRRERLVGIFTSAEPATLCHGDPRADNLVFRPDGRPVFFDWQQLAIQFGEADLAWMAATSLTPENRRRSDDDLVAAYGTTLDRYRLGFVLPGLAVLLLAQRSAPDERSQRFIATSLARIGTALADLDVASIDAHPEQR